MNASSVNIVYVYIVFLSIVGKYNGIAASIIILAVYYRIISAQHVAGTGVKRCACKGNTEAGIGHYMLNNG